MKPFPGVQRISPGLNNRTAEKTKGQRSGYPFLMPDGLQGIGVAVRFARISTFCNTAPYTAVCTANPRGCSTRFTASTVRMTRVGHINCKIGSDTVGIVVLANAVEITAVAGVNIIQQYRSARPVHRPALPERF